MKTRRVCLLRLLRYKKIICHRISFSCWIEISSYCTFKCAAAPLWNNLLKGLKLSEFNIMWKLKLFRNSGLGQRNCTWYFIPLVLLVIVLDTCNVHFSWKWSEWQLHFYCVYCREKCHAWKGDFNFNEAFMWLHKGYLLQIANWFYSNLYSLSYQANTISEKPVPIWGLLGKKPADIVIREAHCCTFWGFLVLKMT